MKKFERKLIDIYDDVFNFTVSRVKNVDQAEDITQSVMETAIAKIKTLRKEEAFKPWVMQIAANKINAYYNGIRRYNTVFTDTKIIQNDDAEITDIDIEDIKTDILQRLVNEEDQINIMRALDNIEKKYQEVIRLNIICEFNLIQTSEILNINVNTARTWSARGLLKLRDEFERLDKGDQNV